VFVLQSWKTTLPIALVSMSIPFGVGVGTATWLFTLEPDSQYNRLSFLLFIGTVFSFSAFPVLARILDSSKLISSPVGIQALGLAALEDVVAWCVLALIISYSTTGPGAAPTSSGSPPAGDSVWNSILIFVILVVFIAVLMLVVRPLIQHYYSKFQAAEIKGDLNTDFIPYLFFGFLISSWFTETLGIHAFFGSFLWGCILPKEGDLIPILAPKIELLIVHIFLPIYFASSGMKTQLQTLDSLEIWMYTFLVILLASCAKVSAVTLSSKLVLGIRKKRIEEFLEEEEDNDDDSDSDDEEQAEREGASRGRYAGSSEIETTSAVSPKAALLANGEANSNGNGNGNGPSSGSLSRNRSVFVAAPLPQQHRPSINRKSFSNGPNGPNVPSAGHSVGNIDYEEDEGEEEQRHDQQQQRGQDGDTSTESTEDASDEQVIQLHRNHLPAASPTSSTTSSSAGSTRTGGGGGGGSGTPTLRHGGSSSSGIATPLDRPSSHSNRTHAIPEVQPGSIVGAADQDEFGLDIHTGLPVVSSDLGLIEDFAMHSWQHCLTLGVLLNSRGLVALIVLNIGLDKQIIGPKIFSMMLTMSLVCTCLTSPIVYALYGHRWQRALLKIQASELAEQVREEEELHAHLHGLVATNGGASTLMQPGQLFQQDWTSHESPRYPGGGTSQAMSPAEASPRLIPEKSTLETPLLVDTTGSTSPQPISVQPVGAGAGAGSKDSPAGRFKLHGRMASMVGFNTAIDGSKAAAANNSTGGGSDASIAAAFGSDSRSGSYIPPSLLARLRIAATDSNDSSGGTSPIPPSHVLSPTPSGAAQPASLVPAPSSLGLGLSARGTAGAGGAAAGSRFGAPMLITTPSQSTFNHHQRSMSTASPGPSAMLGTSPANWNNASAGGGGMTPIGSLQRRGSLFTLSSSPSAASTVPQSIGDRSISTRNLLAQPNLLQQHATRTRAAGAGGMGSGRNTPRANGPSTPRGSGIRPAELSSRHLSLQPTSNSPNSAGSPQPWRIGSAISAARSMSPSGNGMPNSLAGLSQTPSERSWLPQATGQIAEENAAQADGINAAILTRKLSTHAKQSEHA
jgi:Kef-type K+ transport system membrane component KefB